METLPYSIAVTFILTTIATIWMLYKATRNSKPVLMLCIAWLTIQGVVSITGFYTNTVAMPPRFLLLAGPALLTILLLFILPAGRHFLDTMNLTMCTWLHVVRVPVEIVLLLLYLHGAVPQLMTFEGRNFDILSGITAPVMALWVKPGGKTGRYLFLIWNFICLGLLINIVVNAVLSAPFRFQQFAFNQPNVAVLYFPFVWLPGFIVPTVLLCHLAAIRQLLQKRFSVFKLEA